MAAVDLRIVRVLTTLGLAALLATVAGGAFDAVRWDLFVPVVIVGAAALLVVRRRLLVRVPVLSVAVAVAVVGAVLAAGGSFADAGRSVVQGPRQLLTTEWPSPALPTVVGAVALLVAVVTAVAADLAGRRRLHLAPLAVVAAGWIAALSIGAPVRPPTWILLLGGAGAVVLSLEREERGGASAPTLLRSDRTVALTVGAVAVASVAAAGAVAWADRADPRQTQDAELNAPVIDPIEATVALRRARPPFELFSIVDRSRVVGQSLPARWRIAALDTYDGQRWVPDLQLRPIGGRLGLPAVSSGELPPAIDFRLEYRSDDVDLLPFPGPPLSASIDVETDLDRVAVRPLRRPTPGTTVLASSDVALTSRSSLVGLATPRSVDELAAGFTAQARRIAGQGTELEQLRRIEGTMRDEWQLDPNAPGSGQQLALIERFVVDTNRGTNEQFVTAFVLLVRSLGFDARVATGFIVPPESVSSPLTLTSDMANTWPEVRFQSVGWIAFDPVPSVETIEEEERPPTPEAQTPVAAQPPIAPPADEADDVDDEELEITDGSSRWEGVRRWLVRAGAVGAVGVLPFVLVVGTIVGLKWRRRRRRRTDPDPVRRIRGVWANVTDGLVDAGLSIAPSWTDDRIAGAAAATAPGVPHELRRLAAMATQVTFGSTARADNLADDAVRTARTVDLAIRADRTRWRRAGWWLSLRSLRRATRSPVRVDVD